MSFQILPRYIMSFQLGFIDYLMNKSYVCKVLKEKMTLNYKNIITKKKSCENRGKVDSCL